MWFFSVDLYFDSFCGEGCLELWLSEGQQISEGTSPRHQPEKNPRTLSFEIRDTHMEKYHLLWFILTVTLLGAC